MTKIRVDITNYNDLSKVFDQCMPEAVIHMAAYGDVDGCERNPALAWEVNVKGYSIPTAFKTAFKENSTHS